MFLEDRGGTGGGGITRVDINKHTPAGAITTQQNATAGTTIYTTQANRPTLTGAASSSDNAVIEATDPDVTSFAAGDFFTMDIDDRPTGPLAVGLTVQLHVQYT